MKTTGKFLRLFTMMIAGLTALSAATSLAITPCGWSIPRSACPDFFDPPCPGSGSGGCSSCGMPSYCVSEPYINLRLEDVPLFYSPSRGFPIEFRLSYRQRGVVPEDPAIFGVGTNWSCSLRYYLVDQTSLSAGWMRLHRGGAGLIDFTNNITQYRDGSLLTGSGGNFQIEYADGSVDYFQNHFVNSAGTSFYFITSQVDPAGNTITYNYS